MESGVSEDAVSGHIQLLLPGRTACFECLPPLIVASGIDEKTLKREGVCAASLPTTMGLVAAMLVQNALKYLLSFGQVSYYLGYNAMNNFFPSDMIRCNKECTNNACRRQQTKWDLVGWSPQVWKGAGHSGKDHDEAPIHDDNEWGIEVEGSSETHEVPIVPSAALASGISYAYDSSEVKVNETDLVEVQGESLDDLMSQLQDLSS